MSDHIVDLIEAWKIYQQGQNEVVALANVSLQISRGEYVAIMGPSGSGKSTLMHLLGCLDKPTRGKYFLNNQDISQLNDSKLSFIRSNHIGFVFQSFNLLPELTVLQNIELPFIYRAHRFKINRTELVSAAEKVGLSHRLNHLPRELSGGEMQRAAIARALAINPTLILADEPTGNLDVENGKAILKLFQQLNQQGVTIVLVTHDESVARHSQRIIRMQDGKIIHV